jgi:hypothetical protein
LNDILPSSGALQNVPNFGFAKSWPNLAKQPDIVGEEMPTVIGALKRKSLDEIAKIVKHIANNHFAHG